MNSTHKTKTVGVIGLGYVGLPLSMAMCQAGYRVIGVDVDANRVARIQNGASPVEDVPDEELKKHLNAESFQATTDFASLSKADAISICVPTPLGKSKNPDMSYVVRATEAIAKVLQAGQTIILESTVYPGATEELILPILSQGGLQVGKDFFLAFSPERVDPGNVQYTIQQIPKVVGGITPRCTEKAVGVYQNVFDEVIPVKSTREAEMSKLLENTFRSVNIGLINELALVAHKMQIDIWEVITAAASKPFGFMPFYPGPGLGGHCIPIDPFYLSWKAKMVAAETGFIELAGRVNAQMPQYVVDRIITLLNEQGKAVNGANILILGVAYKRDVGDMRESPSLDVIGLLHQRQGRVCYHDPHVPQFDYLGQHWKTVTLDEATLKAQDLVVILTDHSSYDYDWIARHSALLFDTRNATSTQRDAHDHIEVL